MTPPGASGSAAVLISPSRVFDRNVLSVAVELLSRSVPSLPRYHFDWALGQHRVRDYDGVELADDAAARESALTEIRELLETTMGKRLGKDCKIEVCDANRHLLFSVDCKDT